MCFAPAVVIRPARLFCLSPFFFYFRNTKYTASTRNITATKWFHWSDSPLKSTDTITPKTRHEITSCITFSCTSEKGPPFMSEPMRLAGMRNEYSSSATHQLMRIMNTIGVFGEMIFMSCSFRLPYQARVMKLFEMISRTSVRIIFVIVVYFYCFFSIFGGSSSVCMLLIAPHRLYRASGFRVSRCASISFIALRLESFS